MLDTSKVYTTNNYGDLKVINYIGAKKVEVEFVTTGYRTFTRAEMIVNGAVKDITLPSVYGIGFIGYGKYKVSVKGKHALSYKRWTGMLMRCYCPSYHSKNPTYKTCTVDTRWHNYQNFAEWFEKNYVDGYVLDKDIKVAGNKVYGPDTCMMVTVQENQLYTAAKNYTVIDPAGIVHEVYNMAEFCKKHKLTHSHMSRLCSRQVQSHKGWKLDVSDLDLRGM